MEQHNVDTITMAITHNYDDNVMCASVWFEVFGGLFKCQNL